MKLEVKIQLLKFCSHVFNAIFTALGLSVAGCAIWILFGSGNFLTVLKSEELRTVGFGLLLIGALVLLVSVVGCVGADGDNRLLLLLYLGLLIVLVLGQVFVTLLLLINRVKIERSLDQTVDQHILQYGQTGAFSQDRLLDSVQTHAECCGLAGPSDWLRNSFVQTLNLTNPDVLPCSCFRSFHPGFNSSWCSELQNFSAPLFGRGNASYEQGCREKLSDWLQENALTILGMDAGLILIQVLQFGLMVNLYRAFGAKSDLKRTNQLAADSDQAHLDPAHPDPAPEDHLDDGEQNYGHVAQDDDGHTDHAHPAQYY